jgi:hypothetical protein
LCAGLLTSTKKITWGNTFRVPYLLQRAIHSDQLNQSE